MFVRVEVYEDDDTVEGYVYENQDGDDEFIKLTGCGTVYICDNNDEQTSIYVEDIPTVIKALQAAYDHIQKGK